MLSSDDAYTNYRETISRTKKTQLEKDMKQRFATHSKLTTDAISKNEKVAKDKKTTKKKREKAEVKLEKLRKDMAKQLN